MLLIAGLVVTAAWAKSLTTEEALSRALGNASQSKGLAAGTAGYQLCYTSNGTEGNLFYVFNNTDGRSFVVTSADDLAPAVLAYGTSSFDATDIPDGTRFWLSVYEQAISNAIRTGKEIRIAEFQGDEVAPLITDKWGQSAPFNNMCPMKGDERCITGCVATATGMVMHYWKHGNFNWELLQMAYGKYYDDDNRLQNMEYSEESAEEVAKLLSTIGEGIHAHYGTSKGAGTAAMSDSAVIYLMENHEYDKGVMWAQRTYYNDEDWQQMIYNELQAGRPLLYSGQSPEEGGHCFICDGYDGNGYFHFNWGWQGHDNGYFLLIGNDPLDPHKLGDGKGFVGRQAVSVGLQPDQGNDYTYIMASPNGYMLKDSPSSEQAVEQASQKDMLYISGGVYNSSFNSIRASIGMKFENVVTGNVFIKKVTEQTFDINRGFNYYGAKPDVVTLHGTYYVKPVFCLEGKDDSIVENWQEALLPVDLEVPTVTFVADMATKRGDADGNGMVTINDANLVVNYYLGNVSDDYLNMTNADIDHDGTVAISDANGIVNLFLNPEEEKKDLSFEVYNPIVFTNGFATGLSFGADATYFSMSLWNTSYIEGKSDDELKSLMASKTLNYAARDWTSSPIYWTGLTANHGYTVVVVVYNKDMSESQVAKYSFVTQDLENQPLATPSMISIKEEKSEEEAESYVLSVEQNSHCAGYYIFVYNEDYDESDNMAIAYMFKDQIESGKRKMQTSTEYGVYADNKKTVFTWPVKTEEAGSGMGGIMGYYNGFMSAASKKSAPVLGAESFDGITLPEDVLDELRQSVRNAVFVPVK